MLRCLVDYPRPTSRLTGKPRRLTAPGLGLCPMTRPRSDRLVRTRRTRPTEQLALRIRCLALPSLSPITRGTRREPEVAEVEVAEAAVVGRRRWWRRRWWRWRRWRWRRWRWRRWWGWRRGVAEARHDQLLHAGERGVHVGAPARSDDRVADSHARRERARCDQRRRRRPGVRRHVVLRDVVQPVERREFVPPIEYSCPWKIARPGCSSPSACPAAGRRSSTRSLRCRRPRCC